MNYRITATVEVEANSPGEAITKALSGEGEVKQANVASVPKRASSQPVGDAKVAQPASQ